MFFLSMLVGCTERSLCEWESEPFTGTTWGGLSSDEWAEPYVGSWVVEPVWLSEDARPPIGVAEMFQIELTVRDDPLMVRQIVESGSCDETPTLEIPLEGSVQSVDGSIQAIHVGSEADWRLSFSEVGVGGLTIWAKTNEGSLNLADEFSPGDPEDGHSWWFYLSADAEKGELGLAHVHRNRDINLTDTEWGEGKWFW